LPSGRGIPGRHDGRLRGRLLLGGLRLQGAKHSLLLAEDVVDRGLSRGQFRGRRLLRIGRLGRSGLDDLEVAIGVDDSGESGRLVAADLLQHLALAHEGLRIIGQEGGQRGRGRVALVARRRERLDADSGLVDLRMLNRFGGLRGGDPRRQRCDRDLCLVVRLDGAIGLDRQRVDLRLGDRHRCGAGARGSAARRYRGRGCKHEGSQNRGRSDESLRHDKRHARNPSVDRLPG
jgi:hypothetical protein